MENCLLAKEKEFLENAYSTYKLYESSQNRVIRNLIIQTFEPFISKDIDGIGLELGYADGYETALLSKKLKRLDVIEGSKTFWEEAQKRALPNVTAIYSLFEEYTPKGETKYDYVFANYVFEHVLDVRAVLKMIKAVLQPEGLLFVTVPNARAFSRQLALRMNLITNLYELTENDKNHGHRRVYDRVVLNKDLEDNGFMHVAQGGIMFKILADFQLDQLIDKGFITPLHIDGLYKLGLEYPDFAGSIFSICKMNI